MSSIWLPALPLLDSTIRLAAPLVLAALAGLFCERAGVVNIALEGKMLGGAFAAAAVAQLTGSAWAGLFAAMAFSLALALVHGFATITHKGDQVVSGMALNILVAGLGPVLANAWFQQAGRIPVSEEGARFTPITLPFAEALRGLPILGDIYAEVVSGHNFLVYVAALAVPATWWIVWKTRFGLRLRAVGENPAAVDTAGQCSLDALPCPHGFRARSAASPARISPIAQNAGYLRDMSAGKGYLALAALIFGKWRPVPTMLACLLFAFTDALQIRLQGDEIPGIGQIPSQFVQAIPYVVTVLLLAGFVGKAVAPKAIGVPYSKVH